MRPRYNHLYVVAFSIDSDDREGGSPAEIMRALKKRVWGLRSSRPSECQARPSTTRQVRRPPGSS